MRKRNPKCDTKSTRKMGSIQEDRRKVEQFHFFWNIPTICGTASHKFGTAPQKVEQVLQAGRNSINFGTVTEDQIEHFEFVRTQIESSKNMS